MSSSKQIQETKIYSIQECIVRLVRDPLLIPKQEINQNEGSLTIITPSAARETKAEVLITPLSPLINIRSEYKPRGRNQMKAKNKTHDDHHGNSELFNDDDVHEDAHVEDTHILEGENSNDNLKRISQKQYTCDICDDICTDEVEFKRHLDFHLELHNRNDAHTGAFTLDNTASSSDTPAIITNSSLTSKSPPITSVVGDSTNNSKIDDPIEVAAITVNCSPENLVTSSNSTQTIEDISGLNGDNPAVAIHASATKPKPDDKLAKQKAHKAARSRMFKELSLKSQKLPKFPIRKCDCSLKKLDSKCELCRKRPTFLCENCKNEFASYPKLEDHFADAHKSVKCFCQECGKGFAEIYRLKKHMDRHSGLFACNRCTKSFDKKYNFEMHIVTHRMKCDQCDKTFPSATDLKTHKLEIHEGVTYTCEDCKQKFSTKGSLKVHIIRYHRMGEYKCKHCSKIYESLGSYRKHIYTHKQKSQVICDECGKEISSNRVLKQHKKLVHRKEGVLKPKYECKVCKKEFSSNSGKRKCEDKHAGIARYKCNMCDKTYFHSESLVIHKRIHTGEKPYLCMVCRRRFYSSQMLLKHSLSHGIPEKEIRLRLKTAYQPEKPK